MFHREVRCHVMFATAVACVLFALVPSAIAPPDAAPVAASAIEPTVEGPPVACAGIAAGLQQRFTLPDNLPAVERYYRLSDDARRALLGQGFVALPDADVPLLSNAYFALFREEEVSVVITTDVALHLFHNVYDGLLTEIERGHLVAAVGALVGELYADSEASAAALPDGRPLGRAAARHNAIVFAVAARLLDDAFPIPAELEPEASAYVSKVIGHDVTEVYPGDDYTIYEPRGHYAGDADLERYFRAVKWLGRRIYRIEDRYFPDQADIELTAAAMLAQMVTGDPAATAAWERVYGATSLMVGSADSITPVQMMAALRATFGDEFDLGLLETAENRGLLRAELAKDAYPTSEIIPVPLAFPDQIPPKYVQVMGERYLADAALMHQTTFPAVPGRTLPSGLDVMATVLGSDRAVHWLAGDIAGHPALGGQLTAQQADYDARPETWWTRSVYNRWLYSLRPVFEDVPATAPAFSRTTAWQDKQLNTALGSWTQLRHDVILYGKQTVVPMPFALGPGLVEPVPATFERLAAMCATLRTEVAAHGMLPPAYEWPLTQLGGQLGAWASYARKVRDGQALTEAEQGSIHRTGLWLLELFARQGGVIEKSPLLVADVATDANTGRVLHEGTGHFRPLIVVYTPPGGDPIAGIGFAFRHYEFAEADWNRLTDAEWEARLAADPPTDPPWVAGILPPGAPIEHEPVFLPSVRSGRDG